jgi:hypothetical protein
MSEQLKSEFYQIDAEDNYHGQDGLVIEWNENDTDYPISITAELETGEEIGLILTALDVKRILAQAWVAGII